MNIKNIFTPKVRRWLYGIAIAFVPLAVLLGWIKPEAVPVILPLILAIFNVQDDPTGTVSTYNPSETGDSS